MYERIDIQNFRGLRELHLESLGRVNLIVGDNDAGKTSLLEALTILGRPGDRDAVEGIALMRGFGPAPRTPQLLWRYLFTDGETSQQIVVAAKRSTGGQNQVTIRAAPLSTVTSDPLIGSPATAGSPAEANTGTLHLATVSDDQISGSLQSEWRIDEKLAAQVSITAFNGSLQSNATTTLSADDGVARSLSHRALASSEEIATYFTQVNDSHLGAQLVGALSQIDPRISDLSLGFVEGCPLLRVRAGEGTRLPLGLLGDGPVRVLEMLLPILAVHSGSVLIDEVDCGVYHGHLESMWRAIDRASASTGVQIFATTHSWECIGAAVKAFFGEHENAFRMYRLERKADAVTRVVPYDYEIARTATEMGQEVR